MVVLMNGGHIHVWLAILKHVILKLWDENDEQITNGWTNDDKAAIAMPSCTTFQ